MLFIIPRSKDDDDDDEFGSAFEADLANMELEESEAAIGDGPENQQSGYVKWSRPEPPKLDPQTDALIFQQIDIENYIGQPLSGIEMNIICALVTLATINFFFRNAWLSNGSSSDHAYVWSYNGRQFGVLSCAWFHSLFVYRSAERI